jgi:hypothetical protein
VDIDSIDLPVVGALLEAGLRPSLLFVEYHKLVPLPVKFAALEASSASQPVPTYGMGQHWSRFHCNGASLAMWRALGRRYGYALLQSSRQNALFVPAALARALNAKDSLHCHAHAGHEPLGLGRGYTLLGNFSLDSSTIAPIALVEARRAEYAAVLESIGKYCVSQRTPFTVEAMDHAACACSSLNMTTQRLCKCDARDRPSRPGGGPTRD